MTKPLSMEEVRFLRDQFRRAPDSAHHKQKVVNLATQLLATMQELEELRAAQGNIYSRLLAWKSRIETLCIWHEIDAAIETVEQALQKETV